MIVSDKYLRDLLREVVSLRAGGHCEFPGCACRDCDPHHWESKENNAIRYDSFACLYLCAEHHTGSIFSAHHDPLAFKQEILLEGVRSPEWADQIHLRALQIVKADNLFRVEWKIKLLEEKERLMCQN